MWHEIGTDSIHSLDLKEFYISPKIHKKTLSREKALSLNQARHIKQLSINYPKYTNEIFFSLEIFTKCHRTNEFSGCCPVIVEKSTNFDKKIATISKSIMLVSY